MKIHETSNRGEPRATAYYYGDLEKLKRQPSTQINEDTEISDLVKEAPKIEIPPLRDRPIRQLSLPEYTTPEGSKRFPGETYSTAGTFPMPEQKEKEPLLAELEVVGRVPLTQLENAGVRRSRSWYFCCPKIEDEDISRESSWRYSSLRTITAPPMPNRTPNVFITTQSSQEEDITALKASRDSLARALSAERARSHAAACAHDARLAELHGVIAELMRRGRGHIAEEASDDEECESTTQPAGDFDKSRTEQNDSSSLSGEQLSSPGRKELPEDSDSNDLHIRLEKSELTDCDEACEASLDLSEQESDVCHKTKCCDRGTERCERDGVSDLASPGLCEIRQPKIASRVKIKKTEDSLSDLHISSEEIWCAEQLAREVGAQAELREALARADTEPQVREARSAQLLARCVRLEAELELRDRAGDRAADTLYRMYACCSALESSTVRVCAALRAADRALEVYDVLLALAEATEGERVTAEAVANQVLLRLENETDIREPLLSPGPWSQLKFDSDGPTGWDTSREFRLRDHAARLKRLTTEERPLTTDLFSYHEISLEELPKSSHTSVVDMETAVLKQETARMCEERLTVLSALAAERAKCASLAKSLQRIQGSSSSGRRSTSSRDRHRHTDL